MNYTVTVGGNALAPGTLRQAITDANTSVGVADMIDFDLPPGTTTIELTAPGLPTISDALEINGPGAGALTVDGNLVTSRVFANSGAVTKISGLTITAGKYVAAAGMPAYAGGVENLSTNGSLTLDHVVVTANQATSTQAAATAYVLGAGISNFGTMTVQDSTISANAASASASAGNITSLQGAGIHDGGLNTSDNFTLRRSTVSGNIATVTPTGNSELRGAGIYKSGAGTMNIDRSTISGNKTVANGGNASAQGAGIFTAGTVNLTSSTVTANDLDALNPDPSDIANLYLVFATVSVKNTIISAPVDGPNCNAAVTTTLGHNLEDANTCGFVSGTDQINVAATGLDPALADHGGPTLTHELLPGSPAIDAGLAASGETTDQRGSVRPSEFFSVPNRFGSDGSDIGAFERTSTEAPPAAQPTPAPAAALTGNRAAALKKCKKKKSKKARKKCKKKALKLPV